jgi:hypothetical protein
MKASYVSEIDNVINMKNGDLVISAKFFNDYIDLPVRSQDGLDVRKGDGVRFAFEEVADGIQIDKGSGVEFFRNGNPYAKAKLDL